MLRAIFGWIVSALPTPDSPRRRLPAALVAVLLIFGLHAATTATAAPAHVSLAGAWRVGLDPTDVGQKDAWFERPLASEVDLTLPGTTDLAGLGFPLDPETLRYDTGFPYTRFPGVAEPERADARGFLARRHLYLGAAWYEREIDIPAAWRERVVELFLERAIWRTDVWVDGRHCGSADSLATPHEHVLGVLAPGRHRLTLRVDNRMLVNLSTITHAYGPETQTRWNGVVGRIELSARSPLALRRLQVHPAADRRSARVVASVEVAEGQDGKGLLRLALHREDGRGKPLATREVAVRPGPGAAVVVGVLHWDAPAQAWDEFHPVRYRVTGELVPAAGEASSASVLFGFRHVERDGRALRVNGRRVFLRGTLDCAVYPRTGHPPMAVAEWLKVLGTVREYGFNHVRFHTWCPPDAAFEAADRLGLYLMPETAAWVDDWTRETFSRPSAIGKDPAVTEFVRAEIGRIGEAYGDHPSFALFCIGNEFGMQGTDWEAVAAWVEEAKRADPRRLYTGTAARRNLGPDDFWVTHAANGKGTRGVGPARTDWDFASAASSSPVPLIAHETGQRPVFPDYADLLPKFRGPLLPSNYVRLCDQLRTSGLAPQTKAFERASARFQMVQYRAEHEAMRRTADYAGYQLLMLNDFTGQSEALVGILDPFWESKGVVRAAEVRAWNAPTVPLARFARYTWNTTDEFRASLEVAHHGPGELSAARASWELRTRAGRRLGGGRWEGVRVPTGTVTPLGEMAVSLTGLDRATALRLDVQVGAARNHWDVWAYPPDEVLTPNNVAVVTAWDPATETLLAEGRRVVWLAHGTKGPRAAQTGFESVYWSAGWWGSAFSSLGVLCDPGHPLLAGFPNDGHSDWQWRELTQGATTLLLDGAPTGYRPVVQPVPDFHFNRLLGQVFEARVGPGRLVVCGYDLRSDLAGRPAARQFRRSLLEYAGSRRFRPTTGLSPEFLRGLAARGE